MTIDSDTEIIFVGEIEAVAWAYLSADETVPPTRGQIDNLSALVARLVGGQLGVPAERVRVLDVLDHQRESEIQRLNLRRPGILIVGWDDLDSACDCCHTNSGDRLVDKILKALFNA